MNKPPCQQVPASPANHFAGRGGVPIQFVVSHISLGTVGSLIAAFGNAAHQASTNYSIDTDGTLRQHVLDSDAPYANGPLRNPNYAAVPDLRRFVAQGINPNRASISIEWIGFHTGGRWVAIEWQKQTYSVLRDVQQWWQPTPEQWATGLALYGYLAERYALPITRQHFVRHSDFDSVSKGFCPGLGMNLGKLIKELGGSV